MSMININALHQINEKRAKEREEERKRKNLVPWFPRS